MNSPRLALHYQNDSADPGWEDLSECGLILAGWDGEDFLEANTSYIIHNKGSFLRMLDHPDSDGPTTGNVTHRADSEQFMLERTRSGDYYITGLSDGRRLSYNGSTVSFAAAGTTGTAVEWNLNEDQHGWFYIDHPATDRRLRNPSDDNYDVVGQGTRNDSVRFRFIKHYLPIPLTETETLPYFEGFEDGIGSWRQFDEQDKYWEIGTEGHSLRLSRTQRGSQRRLLPFLGRERCR